MQTKTKGKSTSINTDWQTGIWAGFVVRIGETIVLTPGGAVRAWTVKRVAEKREMGLGLFAYHERNHQSTKPQYARSAYTHQNPHPNTHDRTNPKQ